MKTQRDQNLVFFFCRLELLYQEMSTGDPNENYIFSLSGDYLVDIFFDKNWANLLAPGTTLLTLLRIPFLGRIGSISYVLPIRQNIDILNIDIRDQQDYLYNFRLYKIFCNIKDYFAHSEIKTFTGSPPCMKGVKKVLVTVK